MGYLLFRSTVEYKAYKLMRSSVAHKTWSSSMGAMSSLNSPKTLQPFFCP